MALDVPVASSNVRISSRGGLGRHFDLVDSDGEEDEMPLNIGGTTIAADMGGMSLDVGALSVDGLFNDSSFAGINMDMFKTQGSSNDGSAGIDIESIAMMGLGGEGNEGGDLDRRSFG